MDKFNWVEWMIEKREAKGWSQSDLAEKVGTTRQTINDYERRRRKNPDEAILSKISEVFGEADDYLPRLAGLLPAKPDDDPWIDKMNAKLRRIPPSLRDAADRMIESLAEGEVEPRQIKTRTKPKTAKS